MSKLAPRNATVEVVTTESDEPFVRKRYRAVYTAALEVAAYTRVGCIYDGLENIRCVTVLGIDNTENLLLEYIPGQSLYESAAAGYLAPLQFWHEQLVVPFLKARDQEISFDSDPSNYIVHAESGELIAVDPVCTDLKLVDYSAVVFVWGVVKLALRTTKFWRYPALLRVAREFMANYLARCDTSEKEFREQLSIYIDVVIGWNKEISEIDGVLMIVVRRVIAIPLYTLAKFAFRYRLISPAR